MFSYAFYGTKMADTGVWYFRTWMAIVPYMSGLEGDCISFSGYVRMSSDFDDSMNELGTILLCLVYMYKF